ncbi:MAG: glycosyltransferase family 2 protein, partial [Pseudomonadota bacterium]
MARAAEPMLPECDPTLLNPDGSFQGTFANFPTLWREFALITTLARWTVGPNRPYLRPQSEREPQVVDWITGAAFVLRRAAYAQVGGLDEAYFMYSEETDWCWRLHQAGWQIACLPSVTVMH